MPKFTKKPIEIEARQFDGTQGSAKAVCAWMAAYGCEALRAFCGHDEPYQVYISTLEGRMTASAGDWIIRGVKGEFYPCKPDIFAATYEDAAIALMRGQSWIMASDRLPERLEGRDCSADVLVSDGKRVWIHCAYFDWKAMDKDYWGDTPYTPRLGSGADRWMPLPQPKDIADE